MNNKVINNASWIILCKVAQSILNFAVTLLSARYLGPSNYGLISYAASITSFMSTIAMLGIPNVLVREIVEDPQNEGHVLGSSMYYSTLCSTACIFTGILVTQCLNDNEFDTVMVVALYSLSLIFQSLDVTQYWYQAKLLSKYTSVVSLISYFVVSFYRIILLISKKSVLWFAVSYSLDIAIISISLLVFYRRLGGRKLRVSSSVFRDIFSKSKHYIIPNLMITIFVHTDRFMLKQMMGNDAAGFYSAAVSCAGITGFIINAFIESSRPSIFESKKDDEENYEKQVITLYSTVIYFCLLQSIFTVLFSNILIRVIYGNAYLPASAALRIVTWYVPFAAIGTVRNIWVLAENRQSILWVVNLLGGVMNVLLNSLLIPGMGIQGAALASFLSQTLTNFGLGFILPQLRRNNQLMIQSLNPRHLVHLAVALLKRNSRR